jgi:hypothetical protein
MSVKNRLRVYYFTTNLHGVNNLALKRIKVSRIKELNDPYEFLAIHAPDDWHAGLFNHVKNDFHTKIGIVCFTDSWESPVMWSHYADKHRGICLGFDVPTSHIRQVNYSSSKLAIDLTDTDGKTQNFEADITKRYGNIFRDSLYVKYSEWEYEKEWRLFFGLDEECQLEGGLYFFKFDQVELELKEVVLGVSNETSIEEIRELVDTDVEVKKAKLDTIQFKVTNHYDSTLPV